MATWDSRAAYKRHLGYIAAIVAVLVAAVLSIIGPGGYLDVIRTRAELEEKRARVEELEQKNKEQLQLIQSLKSDRDALENYARQKGYGRRNEVIQQLPQDSEPQESTGPTPQLQK